MGSAGAGPARAGRRGLGGAPGVVALVAAALAAVVAGGRASERAPAGLAVTVRGHGEVALDGVDLPPVPRFLGRSPRPGLCVAAPPRLDTSLWQAELWLSGPGRADSYRQRVSQPERLASTLCFDASFADQTTPGRALLCGEVTDAYDGGRFSLGCQPVELGGPTASLTRLQATTADLLNGFTDEAYAAWSRRLTALAQRAAAEGLPLFSAQLRLIAVHQGLLTGKPADLAEGARQLAAIPSWVKQPAASAVAAQVAYHRALLAQAQDSDLEGAWFELEGAYDLYRRTADPFWITVPMKQAEILAAVGDGLEAAERLAAALGECAQAGCDPQLQSAAEQELGWIELLEPDAGPPELAASRRHLEQALGLSSVAADRLEALNVRLSLAYLTLRQGGDPQAELGTIESGLAALPASGRGRLLRAWAELLGGIAASAQGRPRAALATCAPLADNPVPRLAAWAASCAAEAERRRGDLDRAAGWFDRALDLHARQGLDNLGQRLPLGQGQVTDDFLAAARLAVERGEPAKAWALLDRLDAFASRRPAARPCGPRPAAERQLDASLEADLEALDRPAAGVRRGQIEPLRRALRERLQDRLRRRQPCGEGGAAAPAGLAAPSRADLRAFALADEVIVLWRHADATVELVRRTALSRRTLRQALAELETAAEKGEATSWRRLAAPLGAALAPPAEAAGEPRHGWLYALHGLLQRVPLFALPMPDEPGATPQPRWLIARAALALEPTAPALGPTARERASQPLFVVDPRRDLPAGRALLADYRRLFPQADVLAGGEARRAAVLARLAAASLFHLDAHGSYLGAFPDLSRLELADGGLSLGQLRELAPAPWLVNLSSCRSGAWPATADRGHYGIAGLFAANGSSWVVASRGDLDDRMAGEFNRELYTALTAGSPPAVAFQKALLQVAQRYPPADWGGMLLLHRPASPPEGEVEPARDSQADREDGLGPGRDRQGE